ncbi:histone-lysine N-methyltransferase SETD5-like isoform X4 [Coregonus clupeaformis]|uniref:histone-lysine N-methyltransferase SETD5-like isoform X4 n=1 Tax=Coregonus clupeaformis TaxID=59861 RepID=UPI001E1C8EFC|nr:histone-lysine N-methyltransferase SETD5-like isoform X4 [Coregonus clupeaformis]
MSIVIALGVTTPETSYSDMAAGSDPESVEASPAVNEKNYPNHSCVSAQSHGYRGLPYTMQQSSVVCCQDHNYGAPPPPTPPASPLSQTIIPRMELNGMARGPNSRYHDNGRQEENSADSDSSSEEEGAVAGWCHCSLTQDGFLIKCESCRGLDRRKGLDGQRRKQENVSVGDSSATESGDEEVSPATVSYTATQHTPTSITLTVNRIKRNKSKKRKKSTEKARGAPKGKKIKAFREGSRKSMRMKNSTTEASAVDETTAEGWESRIRQWTDQYEEATANQYSADVQTLLQLHRAATVTVAADGVVVGKMTPAATTTTSPAQVNPSADAMDTINRTELACNNTVLGSQMQLQLGRVTRVQKHRKILRASRDLEPDTLIIEYRGKVMLKQQFEVNGHFFKKPYPFVLFYSKFNDVGMCVDARTFGNDARFIRRSCTPNAEVRHMIADGMIHLCIYAVTQITKDAEVTIGFDYEFNSCNYKVDCACYKGNQHNCPVQKHNLSPRETLLCPATGSLPTPSQLPAPTGAETRRRKAQRREMEGPGGGKGPCGTSDDSNQPPEESGEVRETLQGNVSLGNSDTEEGLLDGVKLEEGEEEELDENGVLISSRPKRTSSAGGMDELKQEGLESVEGSGGNPTGVNAAPHQAGVGISTRRATYVTEPSSAADTDKAPACTAPHLAPLAAPSKPPPARSSKPRPKSRISRYRSSSSQRARRQRQALALQQAALEQAVVAEGQEGPLGGPGTELGMGDGALGAGQLLDGEGLSALNKGNLRNLPKTKKYLVTEWLNDKVLDKVAQQEVPTVERQLRITTDPTVLATTLNMLPGLAASPLICTAPKHYVRFGSPFNPERRRRPVSVDATYGSFKKRWIQQAQDESGLCSGGLEDGTESTSSHQSNSSSSTPNPFKAELAAPPKKRRSIYGPEVEAAPPLPGSEEHGLLLRPLSPITPPLPSDHPLLSPASYAAAALLDCYGDEERRRSNSIAGYSPLPSLPTSRCNTPLQFENISSPEASPVHRPESISPEPCLQPDFDAPRCALQFPDLSSGLDGPVPAMSDDFSLLLATGPPPPDTQGPLASMVGGGGLLTPLAPGTPSESAQQAREQSFRTEFNLIYTCSPLNANLGNPATTDRRLSQSEGSFSPAESFYSTVSGQGPLVEAGPGSLSPYGEPHYGGGYPDSGTPPHHTSNPPQKKKVSLLEYRKRKQGSSKDPEPGCSSLGTPTSPSSICASAESPGGLRSFHLQPPASPHSSFSSPTHSSISQIEEVNPPDNQHNSTTSHAPGPATQQHPGAQEGTSHWMVPTTVERLREGQGVLERVLRGSLKLDRVLKRTDGSAADKDPDADRYEIQTVPLASPMKSPQRYSPSVYTHQVQPPLSESHHQTADSPAFLQQSVSSPFRGSYSPSAPPPSGQGFYPRLSSHSGLSQDPSQQHQQQPLNPLSSFPNQTTSTADSALCGASRSPGGPLHQPSGSSSMDGSHMYSGGSHLKASLLNSGLSGSPTPGSRAHGNPKTDLGAAGNPASHHASRLSQQQASRSLKPGSPGQTVLQAGSRLLAASTGQHYPQRGTPLSQFQHPPIQGSGVRTKSGSF